MNFLILKEKKPIKPLLLISMAFITACLFMSVPTKVFANNFFVVTQLPTQLDKNMSAFSGFVSNDNDSKASVWFEYGKNGRFEESSNKYKVTGTRDFIATAYGFELGVIYSYRVVGRKENSNIIKYGDTKTFIIEGGSYNTSDQSSNSSNQSSNTSGSSDLSCEQFCANCCPTILGDSSIPTASSGGIVETTNTTATLYGVVFTKSTPTRGWFEWGTTQSLGRVTPAKKLSCDLRVEMKETIYNLSFGTKYYYRTVAVTSAGVSQSAIVSFTTQGEKSNDIGKANMAGSLGGGDFYDQTTKEKDITENNILEEKDNDKEQILNKDSLGGVFAWGSTLRGQFFTIDKKGNIVANVSFNETKKEKPNFLLASAAYGKRFLPNTWSEWGFITIFLYLVISRLRNFGVARKKRKEEKKKREEELQQAHDTQLEQTTNGGGVSA